MRGARTQKNIGSAHSEGRGRGRGRGGLCVFKFIADLLSLSPSPSSSLLSAIHQPKHHNEDTTTTPFHSTFHFSFFFFFFLFFLFFSRRGEPLPGFPFLVFRCGSGWRIKAQAAARVGRPCISTGRLTPPLESAGRNPPAAIAKEIYSAGHI